MNWHGSVELLGSLKTFSCFEVENLKLVDGIDLDSFSIFVSLVEKFVDSFVVIVGETSVLHEFDVSCVVDVSGSTLSTIVHYGNLSSCVG